MDELKSHLDPLAIKERDILLALKREDQAERGLSLDDDFYIWDYRYTIRFVVPFV